MSEQCLLAQSGHHKAAATRLANAGCSVHQVKAITGHRSLAEVARYTKAADQRRLARQALDIQLKTEGEQKGASMSVYDPKRISD
jgi:integrase